MDGPLSGLRILELGGIGPGPFAGMMLADHGAEVIRIERAGTRPSGYREVMHRSRQLLRVNMKEAAGVEAIRRLADRADGVIEGFRPGVAERLGLGPDALLARNPALVYGRMTGWGQHGPLARAAGHDLNYLALSGSLHSIGTAGVKPPVPLNLVGDFGGGGMLLAFGMVNALLGVARGGAGQVVDAAITDGAALLAATFYSTGGNNPWSLPRGQHLLTGAAPFYDTYDTADGEYVAVAAVEPQFYALLIGKLGLAGDPDFAEQHDRSRWPAAKARLAALFASQPRAHWCALLEGTDACFAPVLSPAEAPRHPHNRERGTFVEAFGVVQPAPAPRYSGHGLAVPQAPREDGVAEALLGAAGYAPAEIARLREAGVIG